MLAERRFDSRSDGPNSQNILLEWGSWLWGRKVISATCFGFGVNEVANVYKKAHPGLRMSILEFGKRPTCVSVQRREADRISCLNCGFHQPFDGSLSLAFTFVEIPKSAEYQRTGRSSFISVHGPFEFDGRSGSFMSLTDVRMTVGPLMIRDDPSFDDQNSSQRGSPLKIAAVLVLGLFRADPRSDSPSFSLPEGLAGNPTPAGLFLPRSGKEGSRWLRTGHRYRRVEVVTGERGLLQRTDNAMPDILGEALEVVPMTSHGDSQVEIAVIDC